MKIIVYIASVLVCVGSLAASFYYFFWQTTVGVLLAIIASLCWYLYKFAKIILILEDDLSKAIESLEEVESSMQNIITMKLFFDDPQVQALVSHVMDSVRMAKFSVNKMIKTFTERSKQKFVMIVEEDAVDIVEDDRLTDKTKAHKEGTVFSIER